MRPWPNFRLAARKSGIVRALHREHKANRSAAREDWFQAALDFGAAAIEWDGVADACDVGTTRTATGQRAKANRDAADWCLEHEREAFRQAGGMTP